MMRNNQSPNMPSVLSSYELNLKIPFKVSQVGLRACNKYERDGHWNEKQRLKYVIFLCYFYELFFDLAKKKTLRIYEMMSDMIITRNPNQCRSHHQKMIKHRSTIKEIINSVVQKYEPTLFEHLKHKYLAFIKNILINEAKYLRSSGEGEKTKYIQTFINFNSSHQVKIQPADHEVPRVGQLQKGEKQAQDRRKTNDQYFPNGEDMNQEVQAEQIPIIEMPDIKLEQLPKSNQQQIQNQVGLEGVFSLEAGGVTLTAQGRKYYESQIQALKAKRQWHTTNIQHLRMQIQSQKESIGYCDSTISIYLLALNNEKQEG